MASSTDANVRMFCKNLPLLFLLKAASRKEMWKKKAHIWVVEKLPQPTPCCIQLISRFHTDEEESSEEKYGGEEFGFCMRDLYSPTLCVCGLTCGDFQQPDLITRLFWFGYRLKPLLFLIKVATDCNSAAPACDDSGEMYGWDDHFKCGWWRVAQILHHYRIKTNQDIGLLTASF